MSGLTGREETSDHEHYTSPNTPTTMGRSPFHRRDVLASISAGLGVLAGCTVRNPFTERTGASQSDLSDSYNADAQGIAGDGETEVGEAVQELLDTVDSEGGGVIYFPPGRYLFERTPLVGSNTSLVGAGRSTVFEGVRPDDEKGRALLSNKGYDRPRYGGASNWSVRNLRIDAPDSNGIMPAHAENVRLKNIHGDAIRHHHIDVVSSRNVVVDGYWASRGGEADSNAPIQFDAQQRGTTVNAVWDGTDGVLVADDGTPTERCTLRNFEIAAENGPSHGVHIHRGPHESITVVNGSITGCQFTAIRADPESRLANVTVDNISCLENARGITLGHVERGRRDLTITNVTIRTDDSELAAGSGLYAAGVDGSGVSNVTVRGAFTNSIIFDDMRDLRLTNVTATGAVDQSFRFRENVDVTLTAARAADSGGAAIYAGSGSTVAYGGVTFDSVGSEVAGDGEIEPWNAS